jgi:hypothetical protein
MVLCATVALTSIALAPQRGEGDGPGNKHQRHEMGEKVLKHELASKK